jgi:hypothetical protein
MVPETGEIRIIEAPHAFRLDNPMMVQQSNRVCRDNIESGPADCFFSRGADCRFCRRARK